ncbi:MAG: hypothetical protein BAJALOKI3v1_550004 [Promethearchaeota archaeon]|nr:MAG: hypothetical protein BAJALOKI3v1_550004 [Candidatus Lokiarchaeota archaeon]
MIYHQFGGLLTVHNEKDLINSSRKNFRSQGNVNKSKF